MEKLRLVAAIDPGALWRMLRFAALLGLLLALSPTPVFAEPTLYPALNGDADAHTGVAAHVVFTNRSMDRRALVNADGEMLAAIRVHGDHVAAIGDNIKALIFPLAELPEMGRGKGVKLQGYKQGGLADVAVFNTEGERAAPPRAVVTPARPAHVKRAAQAYLSQGNAALDTNWSEF